MAGLGKWLWTIPLAAASSAPALAQEAQGMCAALDRIVTAAGEPVPFSSLAESSSNAELLPGFAHRDCNVTPGTGISCYRNGAPESLEIDPFARSLRGCLGGTPVTSRSIHPSILRSRELVLVVSGVRFAAANGCSSQCRAGLLAYFDVTLENLPRSD